MGNGGKFVLKDKVNSRHFFRKIFNYIIFKFLKNNAFTCLSLIVS